MPEPDASDRANPFALPPEIGETSRHEPGAGPAASAGGVPERVGRFEVRALLGEGAFGRVYRGFDAELRRDVAIKVPHKSGLTAEFRERFMREARATATIHHPNVCPVYEVGIDDGLPFIVMRFVAGTTLAALLAGLATPMPVRNAVSIVRKLALGIAAAHAQGVVHRDLKPANVLYDTAARDVLVTDFGLAQVHGETQITARDSFLGTPAYMSPEQANRRADQVGPLSDVYGLGVILYHLLTGRVPFTGSVMEVAIAHCLAVPERPSAVRPGLDPRLDAVCLKAMAKTPAERYRSAREFSDVLTEYLRTPDSTAASGTHPVPALPPPVPNPPVAKTHAEGGVETVAEKQANRKTAPAFKIDPPVKVAVVERDDDADDEPPAPRTRPAPKAVKKKRRGDRRSANGPGTFLQNPLVWAGLGALLVAAAVVAAVFLGRGKRPAETAQPPAGEPAPKQPDPSLEKDLQRDWDDYKRVAPTGGALPLIKSRGPARWSAWKQAAEAKNVSGMVLYGCCLQEGVGVPKSESDALSWFRRAAGTGEPFALNTVGLCYETGSGVSRDYVQAREWFEKAAARSGFAPAQYHLGRLYANGRGVELDYTKAREWYEKAAAQGLATAQTDLGALYLDGNGVARDYARAREWFEKAAEQEFAAAQFQLGNLYENGNGLPRDNAKAKEWYEKAAVQGFAGAQNNLGRLYYNGTGVPQDYAKAKEWYEKAAEQNDVHAQFNLGLMYESGNGVPLDYVRARFWYRKASAQGHEPAKKGLERLDKVDFRTTPGRTRRHDDHAGGPAPDVRGPDLAVE